MLGALLLTLQATTVGDTVWLERSVGLPPGVSVRPRPLSSSPRLDALAPPRVVVRERVAVLQYPVVFWRPGTHRVELPGPILVRPDGWSDTLPPLVTRVEVATVLPPGPRDSVTPRPFEAPIERPARSALPILVLLGVVGVLLLPVHTWWRRRGPEPPAPTPREERRAGPEELNVWLAAGEWAAALEGWSALIRAVPGDSPERQALLRRLAGARYGGVDHAELEATVREARTWLAQSGRRSR
jgi:hypothetical protein